ncbi:hypothetical protein [Desulforamulus ferrireducens]|uniref:Uncharacterized protein n=1 Tax=Desulforamulus ferrireducens TaxID=1833852 RepID=A0A1S6IUI0_9FIRM|nr:hypothetical protein [Desulforamulus ferrireducens]AQS58440.1 hypothetical protein B0537_04650 [Desulforamulus ferrireducens]
MLEYPDKHSIFQILNSNNFIPQSSARKLLQQKGIFILNSSRESLSSLGSKIFWGAEDIYTIKQMTDKESNLKKVSRLYLKNNELSPDNIKDMVQSASSLLAQKESIILNNPIKLEDGSYKITGSYIKENPGKVQLLDKVEKDFSVKCRQLPSKQIVIDYSFSDETDQRIIKKVFDIVQKRDPEKPAFEIESINIELLSIEKRIRLFDKFFEFSFTEWEIVKVSQLTIKKDESKERSEEERDVTTDDLEGITKAILDGSGLRRNSFVLDCISKGFYFISAKIRLEHKKDPLVIEIEISFKPKLDVKMASIKELHEDGLKNSFMNPTEQEELLNYFQDIIYGIYQNLLNQKVLNVVDHYNKEI